MYIKNALLLGAFALGAIAAPVAQDCDDTTPAGTALTVEQLTAIAPATASCDGADQPEECADAKRAVAAINKSFETYKITSKGERAAIVAYMLFESVNFKYNRNHFPGRPGQGTRMMAMPPYVEKYAIHLVGQDAVSKAQAPGGNESLDAVLLLANDSDEKSFGSAGWFVSTECTPEIRAGLASETETGWHDFLTECVETTLDPLRDEPWTKALQNMQ